MSVESSRDAAQREKHVLLYALRQFASACRYTVARTEEERKQLDADSVLATKMADDLAGRPTETPRTETPNPMKAGG